MKPWKQDCCVFVEKFFFNVEIGMRLSYSCKNQVYHVDVLCHLGLAGVDVLCHLGLAGWHGIICR